MKALLMLILFSLLLSSTVNAKPISNDKMVFDLMRQVDEAVVDGDHVVVMVLFNDDGEGEIELFVFVSCCFQEQR